ncbi:MAG: hypothetical protein B6U69_03590 [Thermofilum sp. ex4484_15]|nr:MAG: hypothetical protein B6U69_03590 [Thermofilum sp. ex4484_15]
MFKRFSGLTPRYVRNWAIVTALAAVVGVAGGLGAIIFRIMIGLNRALFFGNLLKYFPSVSIYGYNPFIIIIPALGGLIVGPIVNRIAPETKGHGVPEVMEAVHLKGGLIRKRIALVKIAVSSVTIGSGGSAGREGPIAQIGAAIGSLIAQLLNLPPKYRRLLVVCGLASGIAGTFNAPLGGALFGLEIFYRGVEAFDAVPVILASVVGTAVATAYLGPTPAFTVKGLSLKFSALELPFYFLLGIVFGILAVIWVKFFYLIEDLFEKLRIKNSLKPALGGLIVGVLGAAFPTYGIMGVGYEGINAALAHRFPLITLLTLGLIKLIATSFTIGSGGSGGVFAPSLYIGTMLGGALGYTFYQLFPGLIREPLAYSLAGMAALFAGASQAPLTLMIMIPEMCNNYAILPSLMVSCTTSFFVAHAFLKGSSIYTIKLERRGVNIKVGRPLILDSISVGEVMARKVVTVRPDMPLSALELLVNETNHTGFPVVDNDKLEGMITINDVIKVPTKLRGKLKVKDILPKRKLVVTYPDESLSIALDKMYKERLDRLPVVSRSDPNKLIGIISENDIINAYRKAVLEF